MSTSLHSGIVQKEEKIEKILPYLKKLFVCKRHNSLKYDYTGTIHIFLYREERKQRVFKAKHSFIKSQFNLYKIKAAESNFFK